MSIDVKLPYPADKILSNFVDKICRIEPRFVDGVYVTGSLPLNDFYSNKSDIDFLVLCKFLPDEKIALQLKHIHNTIRRHNPKPDLSGCYLTSGSIHSATPENIKILNYHQGVLRYGLFEMAPVSLSELKSTAITLFGPKAEMLPVSIEAEYLNKFLYDNINSYWTRWLHQYSGLFRRMVILLLFPGLTEWSVLGVARQLCTLQTGRIVSKSEAGFYCLEHLPIKFHPITLEAIKIRKDNRTYPVVKSYAIKPSFKRLRQTIECVNYIICLFNKIYHEGK